MQCVGTSSGRREEARVVRAGAVGQALHAGPGAQRRSGFVEPEMAVRADPEDLHVDSAELRDVLLVGGGSRRQVSSSGPGAVGHGEPIDARPTTSAHLALEDRAVGLRVARREADVLVEGDAVSSRYRDRATCWRRRRARW